MDMVLALEKFSYLVLGREKIRGFEDKLFLNKSRMKNFKGFLLYGTIEGVMTMVFAMFSVWMINKNGLDSAIIFGLLAFFAPMLVNYLFQDILFEKRKRQKEELLSDLLLEASIFCDESSTEKTIKRIAMQDFPLLKEDFERAHAEIKNGAGVEEALKRIGALNKSKAYSRVVDLLIVGYKSGAKISELLKETAEDLLEARAILKERQAVMLVTKYTLLLSAGIIVPAILGLIIGLVGGLNFNSMGELGIGMGAEERKALFETAVSATTIYVFEYAALSAFFLALQEGNKKNFFIYGLFLVPIACAIFFAAKIIL